MQPKWYKLPPVPGWYVVAQMAGGKVLLCGKGFLMRIGLPRHRGNVRGYYLLTQDGEAALAAWLKEDN